jgi:hypothetical protein
MISVVFLIRGRFMAMGKTSMGPTQLSRARPRCAQVALVMEADGMTEPVLLIFNFFTSSL